MSKKSFYLALALALGGCFTLLHAQTQTTMTLEQAIGEALQTNFDIRLVQTAYDITKADNTLGNAGMLPQVNLNGGTSFTSNDVKQEAADGSEMNYRPQNSTALSTSIELNWTIFDGGKMFVTKQKLEELEEASELDLQTQVLQTTYDVIAAYCNVIQQKQALRAIQEVIAYNREFFLIAKTSFNAGLSQKQDLLQAQIDLNRNLQNEISQKVNISTALKVLNRTIGRDIEMMFEVSDSILFHELPDREELQRLIYSNNTTLKTLEKEIEIARLVVSENKASYLPLLNLRGGYYVTNSANTAGNLLNNRSMGPQVAGTLSIPLYNSGETKRKVKVAKLQTDAAQIALERTRQETSQEMLTTFEEYDNQLALLAIERVNKVLARELMELSLKRFQYGETTTLEVHLAQENFMQSKTRLINYTYTLKLLESKLRQMGAIALQP